LDKRVKLIVYNGLLKLDLWYISWDSETISIESSGITWCLKPFGCRYCCWLLLIKRSNCIVELKSVWRVRTSIELFVLRKYLNKRLRDFEK
jgi:hypothetical protein